MKRILIIDDDTDVLEVVGTLLSEHGYEVEKTTKGVEVLERARFFKPHLILLDIILDDIDGRELCRLLKEAPETAAIPIIMMSAHPDVYQTILEHGANDIISKPYDDMQLLLRIKRQITQANHFLQKKTEMKTG